MPSISAIILTLNEERNLLRCLNALKGIADEVIIVDSFSTDQTENIAKNAGARFFSETWEGYAAAKNKAAAHATHPILLYVDADEEISENLRSNLLNEKQNLKGAFSMNRLNNYCGKWIRFGGFYPDRKIRMWENGCAVWVGDFVHEKVVVQSNTKITHLEGDLLHYSYYSIEEHKQRLEKYARLGAMAILQSKGRFLGIKKRISPVAKFVKHYFLYLGFLDGKAGLSLAWYSSREVYLKYKYAIEKKDLA